MARCVGCGQGATLSLALVPWRSNSWCGAAGVVCHTLLTPIIRACCCARSPPPWATCPVGGGGRCSWWGWWSQCYGRGPFTAGLHSYTCSKCRVFTTTCAQKTHLNTAMSAPRRMRITQQPPHPYIITRCVPPPSTQAHRVFYSLCTLRLL